MIFKRIINHLSIKIANRVNIPLQQPEETSLLAIGKLLSNQQKLFATTNLHDYEFKIFSQFGEDGIIQYLVKKIPINNKVFIEFGVEDYMESNTRFLMMNNNWSGLVIDGSEQNINSIKRRDWFWRYDLEAKAAFIDKDNINDLLSGDKFHDIGLLSIDIDGNDYHILKQLDIARLNPAILIVEYNSVFGRERSITIPYDNKFQRHEAHYSNLYYGASLTALTELADSIGYALIGCTSTGNNAFFVRHDLLHHSGLPKMSASEAYIESRFRESRNADGTLSYLDLADRYEVIKGMDVLNVKTNTIEHL